MILIFDATPLIYLAKAAVLDQLVLLQDQKIVPASVYREVVEQGIAQGKEDALAVKKLVDSGALHVRSVSKRLAQPWRAIPGIEEGDADCLALAHKMKGRAILDDEKARHVAEAAGIPYGGSAFLLFRLLHQRIIDQHDARTILDRMVAAGWYCTTDLYALIVKRIEETL